MALEKRYEFFYIDDSGNPTEAVAILPEGSVMNSNNPDLLQWSIPLTNISMRNSFSDLTNWDIVVQKSNLPNPTDDAIENIKNAADLGETQASVIEWTQAHEWEIANG